MIGKVFPCRNNLINIRPLLSGSILCRAFTHTTFGRAGAMACPEGFLTGRLVFFGLFLDSGCRAGRDRRDADHASNQENHCKKRQTVFSVHFLPSKIIHVFTLGHEYP